MFPTRVITQRRSPERESRPHSKSNLLIFQYAFLSKNDAIKTRMGTNPTTNVARDASPTPWEISAAVAIKGAID